MSKEEIKEEHFIPCTKETKVSGKIVWRPIRSWHSGTYAGEGLEKIPGTKDGSGCVKKGLTHYTSMCNPPLTVTHRIYWHKDLPDEHVSAFLSYPKAMGACSTYFWETHSTRKDGDIERYFGETAEEDMEKDIVKYLNNKVRRMKNV